MLPFTVPLQHKNDVLFFFSTMLFSIKGLNANYVNTRNTQITSPPGRLATKYKDLAMKACYLATKHSCGTDCCNCIKYSYQTFNLINKSSLEL